MPCHMPGEGTVRGHWGHGGGGDFGAGPGLRRAGEASHLVEEEGPHARHSSTVVYHSRDVTGKDSDGEVQNPSLSQS